MKNTDTHFILLFVFLTPLRSPGQSPFIYSMGSNLNLEAAYRIIPTPDSNYLFVGFVADDANIDREALAVKIDPAGTVLWAKTYGGDNWEEFIDVVCVGGYYYCTGYTRTWVNGSFVSGGGGSGLNLSADVFLVKLNLDGSLVWAKHMGIHADGANAAEGNEVGLRLIPAYSSGVIVVARLNNGATTKQGTALAWVAPDATTHWAYQYNLANHATANESTYGIWRDGTQNFITGGTIDNFADTVGGFLFKINPSGTVLWAQHTGCSPGIFESQLFGYYNHGNGKVYTADYYNQSGTSIREPVVITNLAATGNVPTAGAVPQAVRFHYGTAGSAGNNFRGNIFPVGDGFDEFVLTANEQTVPDSGTTQYVTIISADTDLGYQWAKQVGFWNSRHR